MKYIRWIFYSLLMLLPTGLVALVMWYTADDQTKTVIKVKLVGVEERHSKSYQYLRFKLQYPSGGKTWYDRDDVSTTVCPYTDQIGTEKTVWLVRHVQRHGDHQVWYDTHGATIFCER